MRNPGGALAPQALRMSRGTLPTMLLHENTKPLGWCCQHKDDTSSCFPASPSAYGTSAFYGWANLSIQLFTCAWELRQSSLTCCTKCSIQNVQDSLKKGHLKSFVLTSLIYCLLPRQFEYRTSHPSPYFLSALHWIYQILGKASCFFIPDFLIHFTHLSVSDVSSYASFKINILSLLDSLHTSISSGT